MKNCFLLILFCLSLLLSACSQGEKDTIEYSGIISDGKAMGYEYNVTKEQSTFSWKIGYNGDTSIIKQSPDNETDLESFMIAIGDSQSELAKLLISLSYFIIVVNLTLFLYKKNRNLLKSSGLIIAVLAGFAVYIAISTSFDLNSSLKDARYYYLILTN
ncbi:hypothetical protein V7112_11765 [Bacillus sp. JJ1566]|uniref:hypothetical protein n=1 Tax=Bacillus sp. JJ1566 TaxID=3122961 RepID=UPI002FFDC81F